MMSEQHNNPETGNGDEMAITLLGRRGSPAAYAIRDFLHRSDVPYRWIELTSDEEARAKAQVSGLADPRLPVCLFPDGTRFENPTVRQITEKLGWFRTRAPSEYDLGIYGAGPAGLSAAVYGASDGLKTVLIERFAIGGQAGSTSRIENYLGFPEGISGAELASRARDQALRLGAEILLAAECIGGKLDESSFLGMLDSGDTVRSRSIICATGVEYTRLNLANEERLLGRGFYYGAGTSEASLCRGQVFVVGGGNSAGQAALH